MVSVQRMAEVHPIPEGMGGQMSARGIMLDWLPWLSSIYRNILKNYIGDSTDE